VKECKRCKEDLSLSAFNKNQSAQDGLQTYCRSCQLEANREWSERNPEIRRAQLRRQQLRNPTRKRRSDPAKQRAVRAVYRAIQRGDLERPEQCPSCGGSDSPIQGHHDDYEKRLEVTWLCARCHGRLHAQQGLVAAA